jgi:1-pyrroline-5-carboxylate dehydrogenase
MLSNYIVYRILVESGLPPGVIQFVPGPAPEIVARCLAHKELAGVHFTGSTAVFKKIWKQVADGLDIYRGYPRLGSFFCSPSGGFFFLSLS